MHNSQLYNMCIIFSIEPYKIQIDTVAFDNQFFYDFFTDFRDIKVLDFL